MADSSKPPGEWSQPDTNGNDGLRPLHKLIENLVHDPANPPDTVQVLGYLARSSRDGFLRIYRDLSLCMYCEVPEKHVLYSAKADPEHEEQPTLIILDASAKLTIIQSQTVEASFLKGSIASAYPIAPSGGDSSSMLSGQQLNRCTDASMTYGCSPSTTHGGPFWGVCSDASQTYGCSPHQTKCDPHQKPPPTCPSDAPCTYHSPTTTGGPKK